MPFRTSFGLSAFQSQLGKLVIMPSVARNCSSNINKMGDTSNSQSMEREINARSTLNLEEVDKFRVMAQNWWDPQGICKPLHSMNTLRVPLIRDGLNAAKQISEGKVGQAKMLEGISILDVGCGGGILSQPLARLGANVIGIDAAKESIEIASSHASNDPEIKDNIQFICSTIEEFAAENPSKQFDAIVASEVIEHVENQAMFIDTCSSLLVPGGSFFLSTLNRTRLAYMAGIIGAENILGLLPVGTHDWNKFVTPEEMDEMLDKSGCQLRLIHGMFYWPLSNTWVWIPDPSVNYAVHAIKH